MAEPQADGAYPRLNAGMLASGKYTNMIVSLVGKFVTESSFQCCDGVTVQLSRDHAELPAMDLSSGMVVEIVGQVSSPTLVAVFVVRDLSQDMDLDVYNRMLTVQHNPKFAHYFTAASMTSSN